MRPKRLLLAGGGVRVTAFIGCLEVLEERGILKGIEEYVGVSAGAMMAFSLAIGYTPAEIKEIVFGMDFSVVRNFEPDLEKFGMDDGANLEKFFKSLLRLKGLAADITFEQFNGAGLRMYATDIMSCRAFECSKRATPTMKLVDALRASCALPGYFTPVRGPGGELLTDGGLVANYPAPHLTEEEQEESIGFSFDKVLVKGDIKDIFQFCSQLISITINLKHCEYMRERTIFVGKGDFPAWNFEATLAEKEELVGAGREAAEAYFTGAGWLAGRRRTRRWSSAT